jgi:hypothetical protein
MSQLRVLLPGAVIVKHRDASMIGLPDFSITYKGHVIWCEGKLFTPPKKKILSDDDYVRKAQEESPAQARMMYSMGKASWSLYIIWIKKTKIIVADPTSAVVISYSKPSQAAHLIVDLFNAWQEVPHPAL